MTGRRSSGFGSSGCGDGAASGVPLIRVLPGGAVGQHPFRVGQPLRQLGLTILGRGYEVTNGSVSLNESCVAALDAFWIVRTPDVESTRMTVQ
jgi:hypothetical protein